MTNSEAAARSIVTRGYALIRPESTGEKADIAACYRAGADFFGQPQPVRAAATVPGKHQGWRPQGVEYSSPDNPDWNETYSFQHGHPCPTPAAKALYDQMAKVAEDAGRRAWRLVERLAQAYGGAMPGLRQSTWLQYNFYEPQKAPKPILQDTHEDGHILTMLVADSPGLELHTHGRGTPAVPCWPDDVTWVVIAGQALTYLTGGAIPPIYHRVTRATMLPTRSSLAYFINPDTSSPCPAWVPNDYNQGIDIAQWAAKRPNDFGLPTA